VYLKSETWFDATRLSLRKQLFVTYCFVHQLSYKDSIRETCVDSCNESSDSESETQPRKKRKGSGEMGLTTARETICDYKRYCRELCLQVVVDEITNTPIGGPNKTVEIDESKFGKSKCGVGRRIEGQWIFGGICRETKDFFLVAVPKRDRETLIPLINKHIAPGSKIISDCWAAYRSIPAVYEHLTVNHSCNFVDPDTGAHTQNVENLWWSIKRQLPETYSRHDQLYLHLAEYMWRQHRSKFSSDLFVTFLKDAGQYFKPQCSYKLFFL
jgi:transposase-like protein